MKITLIYVQSIEGNNVIPPLGLMYVAAVVKQAGHNVQLMDVDPDHIDVIKKISKFSPDLIGLSFLTTEFKKAYALSHKLRAAFPHVTLCSGGVHTTVDTENVLRKFTIDFCVVGEGEMTFLEVCKRIEAGQSYKGVRGICFLQDNQLVRNPQRELIKDLDSVPFPARDLVDFPNIYLTFPGMFRGKYIRSTAVMAGRGCYFNCSFCSVDKMFGRDYRLRNPANILQEIILLQKIYGIKGVYFIDSTLTSNKNWIISFCEEIIRKNIKFIWAGTTRVNTVNKEMLQLMKRSGCVQIDYGVESGSPKILKLLNKGISPEDAVSAIKMTHDVGIRVGATFIIGNPDEQLSDLEMTFDLAKKLKANYTVFFFSVPFPGTRLWDIAKEHKLIPEDVSYDTQWNIRPAELPLMAEHIPAEKLQFYRAKFQNYFFMRNYFDLNNVIVQFRLLYLMLINLNITWREIKRVIKHKRWDSFVEAILVAYRKSLYRYY